MKLTLTADWTFIAESRADRIAIAGYTAVIEPVQEVNFLGEEVTVFQYTVLRDHFEIVEVGSLGSRERARKDVETVIANHVAGISV